MIKILIVPDIAGWSTDNMADGIISALSDKKYVFYKKYADDLIIPDDLEQYDIIYIMIPGYITDKIDSKYYHKIRTTFHGGPGTEGQAHQVILKDQDSIKKSYVSGEVKKRLEPYNLSGMTFTPHGIDVSKYTIKNITKIKTFGFAGHVRYLDYKDNQADHRRGYWIMDAWKDIKIDLKIAGGMPDYPDHVKNFNKKYPQIDCKTYSKSQMNSFYDQIDCYLIPDVKAGGPLPALEVGAKNIPLITTNCGLLGDVFIDGKHGILVKDNYYEFVNAILWMENHSKKAIEMGKNWGNFVRKERSWKAVSNHWKEFLF